MTPALPQQPRAPRSSRDQYRRHIALTTRWSDNDVYGHMNNVVHYSLFDSAVNSCLIRDCGLDIHHGERIGLVAETGCRYFAELAFPDPVTAGIRVGRLGRSSVRYEIGLFRGEEDLAAAEGFFVHVYVDRASRRPAPLDEAFRSKLSKMLA